jgi:enoyl-CoA hydratase/carnithine racemase
MMLTGVAHTGQECVDLHIVDAIYPVDSLQTAALDLARTLASKDRRTYTTIRNLMRSDIRSHLNILTQ